MRHLLTVLLTLLLAACQTSDREGYIPAETTDSTTVVRPYGVGLNLVIHADSLLLQEDRPMHWSEGVAETSDTLWVQTGDHIVVAAITVIPEDSIDSIWVKVARDQQTMGWTHECDFLDAAVPDDPISRFILFFATHYRPWCLAVSALTLILLLTGMSKGKRFPVIHFADIPSVYPTLLTVSLVLATVLFSHLSSVSPQAWQAFYFHPTLNPLSQPPLVRTFLCTLWAVILLATAVIDDAAKLLRPVQAIIYLLLLLGVCAMLLLFFSSVAPKPFGVSFAVAYTLFAAIRYWRHARPRYLCGNCGHHLHQKGRCPYCGAIND